MTDDPGPPPASRRLHLDFDPRALRDDLRRVEPGEWVADYNAGDHQGHSAGVALRAPVGGAPPLHTGPLPGAEYADTPFLGRCPVFRAVLAALRCPVRTVRLLRLGAGASTREHRDAGPGLANGEARLHVLVATNPGAEFVLDNHRVVMAEGETWYLDLGLAHRVVNRGETDRVHLVIDCEVNDWLLAMIAAGRPGPSEADDPAPQPVATGPEAFSLFREAVFADPALQARLFASTDPESFARLASRAGRERGLVFPPGAVTEAVQLARRAWFERNFR